MTSAAISGDRPQIMMGMGEDELMVVRVEVGVEVAEDCRILRR